MKMSNNALEERLDLIEQIKDSVIELNEALVCLHTNIMDLKGIL